MLRIISGLFLGLHVTSELLAAGAAAQGARPGAALCQRRPQLPGGLPPHPRGAQRARASGPSGRGRQGPNRRLLQVHPVTLTFDRSLFVSGPVSNKLFQLYDGGIHVLNSCWIFTVGACGWDKRFAPEKPWNESIPVQKCHQRMASAVVSK